VRECGSAGVRECESSRSRTLALGGWVPCRPLAPPPGSHDSPTSPKTAGGGWVTAGGGGSATSIELAPAGGPSPGPSPFVPHGEGRIRSRSRQLVERVTLPRAVCGEGRGGRPPPQLQPRRGAGHNSRTHSRTPALPHSRTPALPHSRTPALPHSRTFALSHSRTPALPHSRTPALPHSRTPALPHFRTFALPHYLPPHD
jgi:hypothetical protein